MRTEDMQDPSTDEGYLLTVAEARAIVDYLQILDKKHAVPVMIQDIAERIYAAVGSGRARSNPMKDDDPWFGEFVKQ